MDDAQATKKVVAIGDLHCGNQGGLTGPKHQSRLTYGPDKFADFRDENWEIYASRIDKLKEDGGIQVAIINGDAICGPGKRQAGIDQLTTDTRKQIDIAIEAITYMEADSYILTLGTYYHTGASTNHEETLAKEIGARHISAEEDLDINGVIFNCKHFISTTSTPYGRGTPLDKERMWNLVWAEDEKLTTRADIIIRSHVHYFHFTGNHHYFACTLPHLSALGGSSFGARIPSGTVHFGVVWWDIYDKNRRTFDWDIKLGDKQKKTPLKL